MREYANKAGYLGTILVGLNLSGCEKEPVPSKLEVIASPAQAVAHADSSQNQPKPEEEFIRDLVKFYNTGDGLNRVLDKLYFDSDEEKRRLLPRIEEAMKKDRSSGLIKQANQVKKYAGGNIPKVDLIEYGFGEGSTDADTTLVYEMIFESRGKHFLKVSKFGDKLSFATSNNWTWD